MMMVDVAVKSPAGWVCPAEGRQLSDILLPVHLENLNSDVEELLQSHAEESHCGGAVLLEQREEGSPCILTLRCCSPDSPAAVVRLLVVSEARTMEVYDQTGEYCGTARGAKEHSVRTDSADGRAFYKKQLILDSPSPSCELKLLSLGGRSSVLVSRVVVGVRSLPPCALGLVSVSGSIDMQQVQSLVEEIGTGLSPGAKNLMDMVQFQQKNHSASLGGFLPLLMGRGALSALTSSDVHTFSGHSRAENPTCEDAAEDQDGGMSEGYTSSSSSSSPDQPMSDLSSTASGENGGPAGPAHLSEMMSQLLKAPKAGLGCRPELLPVLQSVCGQVTQLRLDDAAAAAMRKTASNGSWELDAAMERRLEQMELRLKEHMDRRLDALQQKLEAVLQVALHANGERCLRATPTQDDTTTATTTETHKPD